MTFSTALKSSLVLLLLTSGCKTMPGMPKWDGQFYAADSATQSVVIHPGKPDEDRIHANEPRFDKGVWVSYEDLNCLYQQLILNCSAWANPEPRCEPVSQESIRRVLNALEASPR